MIFISEYPKIYQQTLKYHWVVAIVLFFLMIVSIYINFLPPNHHQAIAAAVLLPFLLVAGPFSLFIAFKKTISVRICPILEKKMFGVSPYDNAELALKFLRDQKKGKTFIRTYNTLEKIATENSLCQLSSFGQVSVYDKNITYFDPLPAITLITYLIGYLEKSPQTIKNKDEIISELHCVLEVLQEASDNNMKFCFAILS
jgi:hypothetical protein